MGRLDSQGWREGSVGRKGMKTTTHMWGREKCESTAIMPLNHDLTTIDFHILYDIPSLPLLEQQSAG